MQWVGEKDPGSQKTIEDPRDSAVRDLFLFLQRKGMPRIGEIFRRKSSQESQASAETVEGTRPSAERK